MREQDIALRGQTLYSNNKTFEVTVEHLALLPHFWVGWEDCEYGAPAIDPKRPYGNSDVDHDIHEILGWPMEDDSWGDPVVDKEKSRALHEEMQTVLQILISNNRTGISAGTYKCEGYTKWTKI